MMLAAWLIMFGIARVQPQPTSPAPASPAPAAPTQEEDPALITRLEKIDAKAALVTDLTAEFEQRRYTPMLKKPLKSSGSVRVKGATARWDTRTPSPSVVFMDASSLKIYYPEQHSLEIYSIASGLARLAATPLPRLKTIREQFVIKECKVSDLDNVSTDPATPSVALLLTPRSEEMKKYVAEVRILLDEPEDEKKEGSTEKRDARVQSTLGVARQVEVTDADGDKTVIVFKEMRANTNLTDKDLELVVPDGTRTSHPLDGSPGTKGTEGKDEK